MIEYTSSELREKYIEEVKKGDLDNLAMRFKAATGKDLMVSDPIVVSDEKSLRSMMDVLTSDGTTAAAIDTETMRNGKPGTIQISIADGPNANKTYVVAVNAFRKERALFDHLKNEIYRAFKRDNFHQYYHNMQFDAGRMADDGFTIPITNSKGEVTAHDTLMLARSMGKAGLREDYQQSNKLVDLALRKINAYIPKELSNVDFGKDLGSFDYHEETAKSGGFHPMFLQYGATDARGTAELVKRFYKDGKIKAEGLLSDARSGEITPEQLKTIEDANTLNALRRVLISPPPGVYSMLTGGLATGINKNAEGRYVVSSLLNDRDMDISEVLKVTSKENVQKRFKELLAANKGNEKLAKQIHKKEVMDLLTANGVNVWDATIGAIQGNYDFNPVAKIRSIGSRYAAGEAERAGFMTGDIKNPGKRSVMLPTGEGKFWNVLDLFNKVHTSLPGAYVRDIETLVGGKLTPNNIEKSLRKTYFAMSKVPSINDAVTGFAKFGISPDTILGTSLGLDPAGQAEYQATWVRKYHRHLIDNWMGMSDISKWFPVKGKHGIGALREVVLKASGRFRHTKSNVQGYTKQTAYSERDNALRTGQATEILIDMSLPDVYDMVPGLSRFRAKRQASGIKYAVESAHAKEIMEQKNVLRGFAGNVYSMEGVINYQRLGRSDEVAALWNRDKIAKLAELGYSGEEIDRLLETGGPTLTESLYSKVLYDPNVPWYESARIPVTDEVKSYVTDMYNRRGGYNQAIQARLEDIVKVDDDGNIVGFNLGEYDPRLIGYKKDIPLSTGWYTGTTTSDLFGLLSKKKFRHEEFLENIPKFNSKVYAHSPEGLSTYFEDSYEYLTQPDMLKNVPNKNVAMETSRAITGLIGYERLQRQVHKVNEFGLSNAQIMKLDGVFTELLNERIMPQMRAKQETIRGAYEKLNVVPGETETSMPYLEGMKVGSDYRLASGLKRGMQREDLEKVYSEYVSGLNEFSGIFPGPSVAEDYLNFINGIMKDYAPTGAPMDAVSIMKNLRGYIGKHHLAGMSEYATDIASEKMSGYDIFRKHVSPDFYDMISANIHNIDRRNKTTGKIESVPNDYATFDVMQDLENGQRVPLTTSPFMVNDPEFLRKSHELGILPADFKDTERYKISVDELSKLIGENLFISPGHYKDEKGKIRVPEPRYLRISGSMGQKISQHFFGMHAGGIGEMAYNASKYRDIHGSAVLQKAKEDMLGGYGKGISVQHEVARPVKSPFVVPVQYGRHSYQVPKEYVGRSDMPFTEEPVYSTTSRTNSPSFKSARSGRRYEYPIRTLRRGVREHTFEPKDYYVRYVDDIGDIIRKSSGYAMGIEGGAFEKVMHNSKAIVADYLKAFGPKGEYTREIGESIFGANFSYYTKNEIDKSLSSVPVAVMEKAVHGVISQRSDAEQLLVTMKRATEGWNKSKVFTGSWDTSVSTITPEPGMGTGIVDWLSRADFTTEIAPLMRGNTAELEGVRMLWSMVNGVGTKAVSPFEAIEKYNSMGNVPAPFSRISSILSGQAVARRTAETIAKPMMFNPSDLAEFGEGGSIYNYISASGGGVDYTQRILDTFGDSDIAGDLIAMRKRVEVGDMSVDEVVDRFKKVVPAEDLIAINSALTRIKREKNMTPEDMMRLQGLESYDDRDYSSGMRMRPWGLGDQNKDIISDYIAMKRGKKPVFGLGKKMRTVSSGLSRFGKNFSKIRGYALGTPDVRSRLTSDGKALGLSMVGEAGPEISVSESGKILRHDRGSEIVMFHEPTSVIPDRMIRRFATGTPEENFLKALAEMNESDVRKRNIIEASLTGKGLTPGGIGYGNQGIAARATDLLNESHITSQSVVPDVSTYTGITGGIRRGLSKPMRMWSPFIVGRNAGRLSMFGTTTTESLANISAGIGGLSGNFSNAGVAANDTDTLKDIESHKLIGSEVWNRTRRGLDVTEALRTGSPAGRNAAVSDIYGTEIETTLNDFNQKFGNLIMTKGQATGVANAGRISFDNSLIGDLREFSEDLTAMGHQGSVALNDFINNISSTELFSTNVGAAQKALEDLSGTVGKLGSEFRTLSSSTRIQADAQARRGSDAYRQGLMKEGFIGSAPIKWWQNMTGAAGWKFWQGAGRSQDQVAEEMRRRHVWKEDLGERAVRFARGRPDRDVVETVNVGYGAMFGRETEEGRGAKTAIRSGIDQFMEQNFAPIVGRKWRGLYNVQEGTALDSKEGISKAMSQMNISLKLDKSVMETAGFKTPEEMVDAMERTFLSKGLSEKPDVVQQPMLSVQEGQRSAKISAENSSLLQLATTFQGHGRRMTALSMGAMGTYFSVTGIYNAISTGIRMVTDSLKDLSTSMKSIAFTDSFSGGLLSSREIMEDLGVSTEDFITGWKRVTSLQSVVNVFLGSIAAKVFQVGEDGESTFSRMADTIMDAFANENSESAENLVTAIQTLLEAGAKLLPIFVDMATWLGNMLGKFAENESVASMIMKFTILAFVMQPLLTIFATTIEGMAGILTLMGYMGPAAKLASRGMIELGTGTAYASSSVWALNGALAVTLSTVATAIIAWQALGSVINLLAGTDIPTPIGLIMGAVDSMGQPTAHASGGLIAPGDDTIISAKTGEYVVNEKATRDNLGLLRMINGNKLRGFFRGGLVGFQEGGLLPSSIAASPAEQSSYNSMTWGRMDAANSIAQEGSIASSNSAKVLQDASGGKFLYVKQYGEEDQKKWMGKGDEDLKTGTFNNILPNLQAGIAGLMSNPAVSAGVTPGLVGATISVPVMEWLKNWKWPDIPARLKEWAWPKIKGLFDWTWPTIKGLKDWIWPRVPEWLKNFKWPKFEWPKFIQERVDNRPGQTVGERMIESFTKKPTNMAGRVIEINEEGKFEDVSKTRPKEGKSAGQIYREAIVNGKYESKYIDTKTSSYTSKTGGIDWFKFPGDSKGVGESIYGKGSKFAPVSMIDAIKGGAIFGGITGAIESMFVREKSLEESALTIATSAAVGGIAAPILTQVPLLGSAVAAYTRGDFLGFGSNVGARMTGGKWADEYDTEGNVIGGHVEGGEEWAKDIGGMIGATINDVAGGAAGGAKFGPVGVVGGAIAQVGIIGTIQDLLGIAAEGKEKQAGAGGHLENQYGAPGSVIASAYNFGTDVGALSRGDTSGLEKAGVFGALPLAAYSAGQAVPSTLNAAKAFDDSMRKAIQEGLANAGTAISTAVVAGATAIKDSIVARATEFGGFLDAAKNAIIGGFSALTGLGSMILTWAMDYIKGINPIEAVTGAATGAAGMVTGIIGSITGAAAGGLIEKTGIINAHAGEVIGPLERVQNIVGGAKATGTGDIKQSISLSMPITIMGNASKSDAKAIGDELEDRVKRIMKKYNPSGI